MLNSNDLSEYLWIILKRADGDEEKLREILASKPRAALIAFDKEFRRAAANLWDIDVPDHTEDMLKDLYAQVVSKGKEFYDHVINNPERIAEDTEIGAPLLIEVAGEVFWEKFGEEIIDQEFP
ncbi:MAG: hypothetical protein KDA84_05580 [Planctomycetaceae bacterium]|nr:hypothetical protein [Planctomycetaceae bacterium]